MSVENIKENVEDIQHKIQTVIDTTVAYYKLWFFKVTMKSTSMLLKFFLLLIFFLMVLFFGSVALALYLGEHYDSYSYGFLLVAGLYLLLILIVYLIKDKIAEGFLLEKFSKVFFNE